ncbi:AAA domain-containing protein [Candidatus Parcubacteria bacterium]|jgi:ATP-dependent Clp protease ATP-binding subunit ClpC|nr:AAA domain-containing protein [Candidatus Parcubacteria bacterium]MBT7228479.1 AAA domain-containing protein [Candidatus Parcubacteria bacterium]
MEAVKFQTCETCGGQGKIDGHNCGTCRGHGSFYFYDNNFVYWDKPLSYAHIFIREFKRTTNLIVNGLLIVSIFLAIIVFFAILNLVEVDPTRLWEFLNTPNKYNFYLWFLIMLNMGMYYRLAKPAMREDKRWKVLKDTETFTKHNIADNLNNESANILDKTWLYARYKKVFPASVWHLLYMLLGDKDIRVVLARLGIGADNLKKEIDEKLATLVGDQGGKKELTENFKESLLNAYFHMRDRQSRYIAEVDLLAGVVMASQEIRNFFYDFDIDEEKINNVITWVNINKELTGRSKRFRSRSFYKPKGGINRSYTAIATPVLDSFSDDLTMMARSGYLPLTIAREKEINEVITTVESSLASVILVGPPGIGKGRVIEGIANRMMAEEVPELFQDKRLVSASLPFLISGASETGKLEERFLAILNEVAVSGNIILYIENIHQLVGISSQGTEGVDLAEVLSSEIRKRNVIVLATTSHKDYVQTLEGSALGQALKKVNVNEPDKNQTIKIMESHVGSVEGKHKVYFTYNALEKIYELSDRYMPDRYLPSKAIDLMDEAAIFVSKTKRPDKLVREEDVAILVSQKTNIPLTQVTVQESAKLMNLEEEIHQRIVGQEKAVKHVSAALRRARAELRDNKRPIVNLLFLGPTGVGKTELAKTVAEKYFGDEKNMIRLDMSEYQNQASLPRLIGSTQGAGAGLLTEAVRQKPFALLLLDEIEKAHPDILNIFLQVMEDGRLTDALGRTVDFTNLIIVATSNAGTKFIQDQINLGKDVDEFQDKLIKEEIRDIFRPEFINRFDGTIVFRPLTAEEIYKIAGFMLKKVKVRLEEKGIFFEVTDAAQRELAIAGFDPVFGARPLRRVIQERVDNALAEFLLGGKVGRRDVIVYDVGGKLTIKKAQGYRQKGY